MYGKSQHERQKKENIPPKKKLPNFLLLDSPLALIDPQAMSLKEKHRMIQFILRSPSFHTKL